MMQTPVGDVMSRNVISVTPQQLLSETLDTMRRNAISCVPVVDNGKAVGMFTERCLVRYLARKGPMYSDCAISELMSVPVYQVRQDSMLLEAFHELEKHDIRHLLVVDEQQAPMGVLTLSSIIERIGSDLMLEFQPIENIMSRVVYTVDQDLPLNLVLRDMAERSISCVIYTEGNRPQGIVTERDIVAVVLEGRDLEGAMLCDVMHTPVVSAFKSNCVHEVAALMREHGTRRVVVVDEQGGISGLVTQSNILQGLESSYIRALKQALEQKECSLDSTRRECDELNMVIESILHSSLDLGIIATDPELCIVFFNQCASELLGYAPEEVLGRKVSELHIREGIEQQRLEPVLKDVSRGQPHTFVYQRLVNGEPCFYKARVARISSRGGRFSSSSGQLLGYVYMIRDITEEKRAEENIRFMAYHDMLTGLPNRVSLNERFSLELSRAERKQHCIGVMALDFDNFKIVNDSLGHYAGDLLLQELARRLQGCLRKSDTVARTGGDEFAILLPEIRGKSDAGKVAEKIRQSMEAPFELKGEKLQGAVSIGISLYPEHAASAKRLLEIADQAMYEAKERGHKEGTTSFAFARPDPRP